MKPETEDLASRIRVALRNEQNLSERNMFGGVCFMLNGNMLCGASNTGNLLLRVGAEREADARTKPHTTEMNFTGRPMRGYIYVMPPGFADDQDLAKWLATAKEFVCGLPPK
ncbi:TfoX/Sxy family protein [Pseudahrensia aquimaris]|uniref:TfoX/Sxy family protein n=1 Tax=Pseudahrensia aquimaris TaxID=744461 RepID=A0ABW3FPL2_9HYPH